MAYDQLAKDVDEALRLMTAAQRHWNNLAGFGSGSRELREKWIRGRDALMRRISALRSRAAIHGRPATGSNGALLVQTNVWLNDAAKQLMQLLPPIVPTGGRADATRPRRDGQRESAVLHEALAEMDASDAVPKRKRNKQTSAKKLDDRMVPGFNWHVDPTKKIGDKNYDDQEPPSTKREPWWKNKFDVNEAESLYLNGEDQHDDPSPTVRSSGNSPSPTSFRSAPTRRDGAAALAQAKRRDDHAWSQVLAGLKRTKQALRTNNGALVNKSETESETGWDLAIKQSQPRSALNPAHAHEARRRVRDAAGPAFAAALDRAVDAKLLTQFAAKHPGGIDAAKLRRTYVEVAVRRFAGEFVKLVGGAPRALAEDIALGAIIAVAIAETSARFPIVPTAATAPMAVLVHRALRPQIQTLARMAADGGIAAKSPAARANGATRPVHEMAW